MLHDFAKADQDWLDDVLRGISDGAPHLADGEAAKFLNAVALRVSPQRASNPPPKPVAMPKGPAPQAPAEDNRNPMQKLLDRFK